MWRKGKADWKSPTTTAFSALPTQPPLCGIWHYSPQRPVIFPSKPTYILYLIVSPVINHHWHHAGQSQFRKPVIFLKTTATATSRQRPWHSLTDFPDPRKEENPAQKIKIGCTRFPAWVALGNRGEQKKPPPSPPTSFLSQPFPLASMANKTRILCLLWICHLATLWTEIWACKQGVPT